MYLCKICGEQFEKIASLSKHITNKHNMKTREYYDKYVKSEYEGHCKFCQGPTHYVNLRKGYKIQCSKCRPSIATEFRKKLKEDSEKFARFTETVAKNQSKIWQEREVTGEAVMIREKIGKTISDNNSKLTAAELRDRYGWMNKLSVEDKEQFKTDVLLNTGCHAWWKNATDDEKRVVVYKRMATMTKASNDMILFANQHPDDYAAYAAAVWSVTTMSYFKHKDQIDPDGKRSKDWHLDHKFSVKAGFIYNVSPEIIGHVANLELLPAYDNLSKCAKCSITIDELCEAIYG